MKITSIVFDAEFRLVSIHNPTPPFTEINAIGVHPWETSTGEQAELIRLSFTRCLESGEPQSYMVRATMPGETKYSVYAVRLRRFVCGSDRGIHCINTRLPATVDALTAADVAFLRQTAAHTPKELAAILGVTKQAVSKREMHLRRTLGVESRYELLEIARELLEES